MSSPVPTADVAEEEANETEHRGSVARRFTGACLAGGVPAVAVFLWFVTLGRADLLQKRFFGNFYDLQARALLHGRWNVPNGSLAFEGIVRNGKTYIYYGPFPALLRMPVLVFSHALDGRLTQLSMLLAYSIAIFGFARLLWRARGAVRRSTALNRCEWWIVAVGTFAFGVGSSVLFPGSVPIVYHEAELWGTALALVGLDAAIGVALRPSRARLVVATTLGVLAILSRPSVGLGPSFALGFIALGMLTMPSWGGASTRERVRRALPVALGAVIPVAVYAIVNVAKFGTLFSTPLDQQIFSRFNGNRQAALRVNGGSLFNLRYLATTLVQYLRPDALRARHLFPFLDFTTWRSNVFLGARFDTLDRASSITATMPALCILGVVGVVAAARRRFDPPTRRALGASTLGAAVAVLPTLAIGFVANRYLIDFLPLIMVPACFGLQLMLDKREAPRSRRISALAAAVALLMVFGVWANVSLGLTYARLYAAPDTATLRGFVGFQESVGNLLGSGAYPVLRTERLGRPAPPDTLAVVGPCDGLYWANGTFAWQALEIGAGGANLRLRLAHDAMTSVPTPIVRLGNGEHPYAVALRRVSPASWQITVSDTLGRVHTGDRVSATPGSRSIVQVVLDRALHTAAVTIDGHSAFNANRQAFPDTKAISVGPGIRQLTVPTPLCDRVNR